MEKKELILRFVSWLLCEASKGYEENEKVKKF